ncbi:MAG: NusA-like transcription termination signal-binding factor [Candidatus Altiarchaeota archaeon]
MAKIRLKTETIKYINLFESMTGAKVKDCVHQDENMAFLVAEGDMGLAIGKAGTSIERVRKTFGKTIWVMEFAKNPNAFIRNIFQPVKIKKIGFENQENKKVAVIDIERKDRKRVLGHEGSRIKIARELIQRHMIADDITIKSI